MKNLTHKLTMDLAHINYELTGENSPELDMWLRGEKSYIINMINYFDLDKKEIEREAKNLQMQMVG